MRIHFSLFSNEISQQTWERVLKTDDVYQASCTKKNKLYKAFIVMRSAEAEHKYKTCKNKLTSVLRITEKTIIARC